MPKMKSHKGAAEALRRDRLAARSTRVKSWRGHHLEIKSSQPHAPLRGQGASSIQHQRAHQVQRLLPVPLRSRRTSMARVKRGVTAHKRHKRLLKAAEGRRGTRRSSSSRRAKRSCTRWRTRIVGRKQRKRQMRALWIVRLNAAARLNGITYSKLIHGLKQAGVDHRPQDPGRHLPSVMRPRSRASSRSPRPSSGRTPHPTVDLASFSRAARRAARPRARRRRRSATTPTRSTRVEADVPRPQGRAAHPARRHRRASRRGPARASAPWPTPSAKQLEAAIAARREPPRRHRARGPARRRACRRHAARPAAVARLAAPHPRDGAGDRARPRPVRVRRRTRAQRSRPTSSTSRRSTSPRDHPARDLWDTIYVATRTRSDVGDGTARRRSPAIALPAADAHVARPDPRHALVGAAHPHPDCPAAATATSRSTPATASSSSRSKA